MAKTEQDKLKHKCLKAKYYVIDLILAEGESFQRRNN
jgi:hypothetical protein